MISRKYKSNLINVCACNLHMSLYWYGSFYKGRETGLRHNNTTNTQKLAASGGIHSHYTASGELPSGWESLEVHVTISLGHHLQRLLPPLPSFDRLSLVVASCHPGEWGCGTVGPQPSSQGHLVREKGREREKRRKGGEEYYIIDGHLSCVNLIRALN